jgi:hypothetical protein|tara:strand:- start:166 stop:372 length:207 start_codon:yes stop_codon:yes gene_type:complete
MSNENDLVKIPAQAKEIVKHKRTGKVYADKAAFDADVADPNTDTTAEDFRQDLEIVVAKLTLTGKTKK